MEAPVVKDEALLLTARVSVAKGQWAGGKGIVGSFEGDRGAEYF